MQFVIPHAPRPVRFTQVPGAIGRLLRTLALGLGFMAVLGAAASGVGRFFLRESAFLSQAQEVRGLIAGVRLPPAEERADAEATLEVLYSHKGMQYSASGVRTSAEYAEGLGHGAEVLLLVDPSQPDRPREARFTRGRAGAVHLLPWALGVGALGALALFLWELRRTLRAEVEPLRLGALVWLTPEGPLPETRKEVVFPATYWRQDVKHAVRARARPGRAPVRKGDKVLAAVVPRQPRWVRVIDEDLARTLGWIR
ncbi:DUF3592 domain-containing protein [Stigmatella aurantiaca]|uniref:Conserved uncharacterized protein n=1 Tax=Stigmatella aurantiaca (strain DW4/3-1) TaxID=378806 RepID=E3FU27_STIAD|nr:DUF3592 domain-containing protein [Stigmatella aurantiaca]ADO72167.1 conserved uncharacterized protein [Stigmatella aurantiaca DW4/3-1]